MRQSDGEDLPSFAEAVTTLFKVCERDTANRLQLNELLLAYANSLVAEDDRGADQVADDLRWLIDILSDVAFAIITPVDRRDDRARADRQRTTAGSRGRMLEKKIADHSKEANKLRKPRQKVPDSGDHEG
jgi:hypothetical protein